MIDWWWFYVWIKLKSFFNQRHCAWVLFLSGRRQVESYFSLILSNFNSLWSILLTVNDTVPLDTNRSSTTYWQKGSSLKDRNSSIFFEYFIIIMLILLHVSFAAFFHKWNYVYHWRIKIRNILSCFGISGHRRETRNRSVA